MQTGNGSHIPEMELASLALTRYKYNYHAIIEATPTIMQKCDTKLCLKLGRVSISFEIFHSTPNMNDIDVLCSIVSFS
jgi:hypothetical protein